MINNKRVLVGMSGGVDSSVSAILLKNEGYEVIGITMLFIGEDEENNQTIQDARKVCEKLEIEHHVYDLRTEFKELVINDFIEKYQECITPNPCIKCNKYMKFGYMFEKAKEFNCKYIATGHYAKVEYSDIYNNYVIRQSKAKGKDQTYVLYHMPKEIVENVLFPLSDFETKDDIREIARENGLFVASKPDSQEICFIKDNDYINFLEKQGIRGMKHGKIVNKDGVMLGKHKGLHRYTIGQRRGIGISNETPLYVINLEKSKNELIVGKEDNLYKDSLKVKDTNCILYDNFTDGMEVKAKIRYSAKPQDAVIYVNEDNTLTVKFKERARAITPGQSIVFYIDDVLVGGGEIIKEDE